MDWDDFIKEMIINGIALTGFPLFKKKDLDFDIFRFKERELISTVDTFTYFGLARKGGKVFLSDKITYLMRNHEKSYRWGKNIHTIGFEERLRFLEDDALEFFNVRHKIKKHKILKPYETLILEIASCLEYTGNEEYRKIFKNIPIK